MAFKFPHLRAVFFVIAIGFALVASPSGALGANKGGVAAPSQSTTPAPTTPPEDACTIGGGGVGSASSCAPTGKATLLPTGLAVAPADAPRPVRRAIRFANQIVSLPYKLGGGHRLPWKMDTRTTAPAPSAGRFTAPGCCARRFPPASFRRWGAPGVGRWISVYYHGGHAFMTIAGLRLDTSQVPGSGPGWSTKMVSSAGYNVRSRPRAL